MPNLFINQSVTLLPPEKMADKLPEISLTRPENMVSYPKQDHIVLNTLTRLFPNGIPANIYATPAPVTYSSANDIKLSQVQTKSVMFADKEWRMGVREWGKNTSPRINAYASNAQFSPGYAWCGFFVAFNYAEAGFKYSPYLASAQKARDFFMYRSYTDRSNSTNNQLDQLRNQHAMQGSQRQYFMLEESPNRSYVREEGQCFRNYNAQANIFNYRTLPIRPGDTVVFSGHVCMVDSYDRNTGKLKTIEGNATGIGPDGKTWEQAVVRCEYDLTNPAVRKKFDGFGRPAAYDFVSSSSLAGRIV